MRKEEKHTLALSQKKYSSGRGKVFKYLPFMSVYCHDILILELTQRLSMLVLDLLTTLLPLELMTPSKSISMEQEFRTAGLSSMLAGLLLGNVSYISLSPSRLNRDAGGHDRWSGALSGALCLLWILVGPQLTGYVPKFVVGGLLGVDLI